MWYDSHGPTPAGYDESMPNLSYDASLAALLVTLLWMLVEKVVLPLIRRNAATRQEEELKRLYRLLDAIKETVQEQCKKNAVVARQSEDLWRWHMPDTDGEQSWKGRSAERLLTSINEQLAVLTKVALEMGTLLKRDRRD